MVRRRRGRGEEQGGPTAELELLNALARATAEEGEADAFARALGSHLGGVVPYKSGYLLVWDGSRGRLFALGAREARAKPVELGSRSLASLRRGRITRSTPSWVGLKKSRNRRGVVCPLCHGGQTMGALVLIRQGASWPEAELKELAPRLEGVAIGLATVLRLERTETRLYELELVNVASRRMSRALDSSEVISEVVGAIQTTFGFRWVQLHRVEPDRAVAVGLALASDGRGPLRRGELSLKGSLVGHCAERQETVVVDDVSSERRRFRDLRGVRSAVAIPLPGEGRRGAVLSMGSSRARVFDRGTVAVLENLSGQVGNLLQNAESYARAQRLAEKLGVLLEVSRRMAQALERENVLQVIADHAKGLMRARGSSIYKLQEDGVTLRPVVSREPRFNRQILKTDLVVGKGIVGSVVANRRPEVLNDPMNDPRALHVPGTSRNRQERMMVAPLEARGKLLGAMTLSRPREEFTGEDLGLFTIFAGLAADTLFISELHGEVRRTKDFLERIVEASADAIVTTDLKGRITLYSPGAEALFGYHASEVMGHPVYDYYVQGIDEGRRIMHHLRRTDRVANYELQFRAKSGEAITCIMSASLLRDPEGRPFGTLGISKDITERVRLEQRLLELSIEDDLTGLYNARHFREAVAYELRRSRRQGDALSLFLFDLDGFKEYNDTKGHMAGDAALAMVGKLVRAGIRADIDKAFRYGGDEFVVVLPGAPVRDAQRIADRLRRKIRAATRGALTISVGLLELGPKWADPRRLIEEADRAMYRAKNQGGDRVEVVT